MRLVAMPTAPPRLTAATSLRAHWPEYALEALQLGLFMVSACIWAMLLSHPSSPVAAAIESDWLRRGLNGLAMGLTAVGLIYSPMGQRSGAHLNPAATLTFWRLGKVETWDAVFYIAAQFTGATAAMALMDALLGEGLGHAAVRHVATLPGPFGLGAAWLGEFTIAFILMLVVLSVSNRRFIAPYTGLFAGGLVAAFIFIESPISGMSMNPARTFGSALAGRLWQGLWVYFTAPPLAMLLAAHVYLRLGRGAHVYCAKLNHFNSARCIFRCRFHEMVGDESTQAATAASAHHKPCSSPLPSQTIHFG
jgi:aquaporin Z